MSELQRIDNLEYANRLLSGIDVREATIRDYQYRIVEFMRFCDGRSIDNDVYLAYKRYLRDRSDWSVSTKDKYLIAARVLLKQMHRLGGLPVDITAGVKGFSVSKQHKKFGVSDSEFRELLLATRSIEDSRLRLRMQALLIIAGFQGLREKEVCGLRVEDLDLSRGAMWITGKGRDDREKVMLHSHTIRVLRSYLSVWGIRSGSVFVSVSNRSAGCGLSVRGLRAVLSTFMRENGVNVSPHGFRKFFTTRLIRAFDGNLPKVKKFTRHKSVTTVMVYNDDVSTEKDMPDYERAFSVDFSG